MKEFFVGLIVIALMLVMTIVGILMMPFIVIMGWILKWVITLLFIVFTVWLIGAVALKAIDYSKKGRTQ